MLGIVVNFCSNEKQFLHALLEQYTQITKHIAVCYGSHMFDGTPEDDIEDFLRYFKYKYPFVRFIRYDVNISRTDLKGVVNRPTAYWCNLARWLGFQYLTPEVDWVLFIDADEIVEADKMKSWLTATSLDPHFIYKLANYWYFKSVHNQATTLEDSILLVHRHYITESTVFHDDERDGIIKMSMAPQKRMVLGLDDTPMFHHFSWVRGRKGLTKKLTTWAHRDDIFKNVNVQALIDHIYKNDDVNDIIHQYDYKTVDNMFSISIS